MSHLRKILRAFSRSIIGALPRSWRNSVYRSLIDVPQDIPADVTFKLAESQDEIEAALRLLHDCYVHEGYMKPHPSGMRVTPYHALPSTSTVIAVHEGKVVGTVSIIRDSEFGFPLESIFDTEPLKRHGARLAEISSLAISKEFRNRGEIFFPFLKYVYEYCTKYFGVDYMVISVNPKMYPLYEGVLFFQPFNHRRVEAYDFVEGAPAIGAYIELRSGYRVYSAHYGRKPPRKNLFSYFFNDKQYSQFHFPDRQYFKLNDPVMTPKMLDYFFNQKTKVFDSLSESQRIKLHRCYPQSSYQEILPKTASKLPHHRARSQRYDVKCKAQIMLGDRNVKINVRNVSANGFGGYLENRIRFGSVYTIHVAIGEFEIATVRGWAAWTDTQGNCGFYLESTSKNWTAFLKHLNHALEEKDPGRKKSA